jgi:hypothetical protein
VEGATRFRGHRPYSAARPPGARSARGPSTCQRGVCGVGPEDGKSDPSRARDRRVDDRDDRGGLPHWRDGGGARRGPIGGGPPCDRPSSNTPGRDHTRRRSRRGGYSADTFSGEAACPRRRSGIAFRLDTAITIVAQERRLARSVGASRRSPRVWRFQLQTLTSISPAAVRQPTAILTFAGRSAAAAPLHPDDRHRRRAPAGLFDLRSTFQPNRSETSSRAATCPIDSLSRFLRFYVVNDTQMLCAGRNEAVSKPHACKYCSH